MCWPQLLSCHCLAWHRDACLPVAQADAAAAAAKDSIATDSDANMAEAQEEAADADETAEVSEQLPTLDGEAALLSLRLLAAIAGYQRCLPGAMADSRIDIGRLLPLVRFCRSCARQFSGANKAHNSMVCRHAVTASAISLLQCVSCWGDFRVVLHADCMDRPLLRQNLGFVCRGAWASPAWRPAPGQSPPQSRGRRQRARPPRDPL